MSDLLVIREKISRKNERITQKISIFHVLQFFPFLCPIANHSHRSSLICSFLKSNGAIRSQGSLQKSILSDSLRSLITNIATVSIPLTLLFRSQKMSDSLEKLVREFPTLGLNFTNLKASRKQGLNLTRLKAN